METKYIDKKMINVKRNENDEPCKTFSFTTHAHPMWTELAKQWYLWENGEPVLRNNRIVKIIPRDLILTPTTLCVWYMDDGTLDAINGNITLCTNGFTFEEVEFLIERLEKDLNIKSHIKHKTIEGKTYPMIYVGVNDYKKIIEMIMPIITWDCFQYKLDSSYNKKPHRGENHSLSKITNQQAKEIITMRKNGTAVKEISKLFKISSSAVSMITSGERWGFLNERIDIKKKPRITKQQKEEILKLKHLGQKEIAEIYNVNQSTVSRILRNSCQE